MFLKRLFRSLPLGTRFSYYGGADVWVILERHECGLIAKWEGVDGWVAGQSICSFADTPEECEKTEVYVWDDCCTTVVRGDEWCDDCHGYTHKRGNPCFVEPNVQIEGQAASGLSRSNAGLGSAKGE